MHGKLSIDKGNENNTVNTADGTIVLAKDITDISKFDFYPAVGITAGVKHFRANIQYQYGVTNILGNLNDDDLGHKSFKANPGILSANLIMYL